MKGIEESNRVLLERLHRHTTGPFDVEDSAEILSLDHGRAGRLLRYLAGRGWLSRVRRGLYTTVPLGASDPSAWRQDPWAIAIHVFEPCYIGGWSAAEHWSLTEQLFRSTVVITARPVRASRAEIQGQPFHIKRVPQDLHFGTRTVWRDRLKTQVSDPTKTIADILDDPGLGGGIRHGASILAEYWGSEHLDKALLVDYALRIGNRTIFKRLGYLLELFDLDAPETIEACRANLSSGLSALDPTVKRKGRIVKRWNLRVNVSFDRNASK